MARVYGIADLLLTAVRREVVRRAGGGKSRILDAACGTGSQAAALARAGHRVIGLDISDAMLHKTKRKDRTLTNVTLIRADSSQMPFRNHVFDVATISFALHEMPEAVALATLEEMKRVTTKAGQVIIVDLNLRDGFFRHAVSLVLRIVEPKYYVDYLRRGLDSYIAASNLRVTARTLLCFGLVSLVTCSRE